MAQKPQKAYKDMDFLSSRDARTIRLLSEYYYPAARFRDKNVKDTIVFYGSARLVDGETAHRELDEMEALFKNEPTEDNRRLLKKATLRYDMSRYYNEARELARLITRWSLELKNSHHRFLVCSGGGPGIMEAVNRGAHDVPGGKSIGLNISLPHEQECNDYISPDLNFEFHYFFMRKFWFVYLAKALVVFPGGFGTMDELWEVLTLIQTNKVQKKMPVVLYGEEYWKNVINFDYMVDHLVIDPEDLQLFKFADNPVETFEYLKEELTRRFL